MIRFKIIDDTVQKITKKINQKDLSKFVAFLDLDFMIAIKNERQE